MNHPADSHESERPVPRLAPATSESAVDPELEFSLIIPAYNESRRLPPYLDQIRIYLDEHYGPAYEVIVVDDGSRDQLASQLHSRYADWGQLWILEHTANQGKGAAIRTGGRRAGGRYVLYADADGAAGISQSARLRQAIDDGADLAIGSRLVHDSGLHQHRSWRRAMLGRVFATIARWAVSVDVRDTQCGFKMFRRDAARHLFPLCRENGYLFDLELLAFARLHGYNVSEVAVSWSDVPGSRLRIGRDAPGILRQLWRLRHRLAAGGRQDHTIR